MALPRNFQWGYATSAFQIEGSPSSDGRGASVWDKFSHTPGKIKDGTNADIACDSYSRWAEDIQLMKSLGVTAYRFSISWARIIPLGGRMDPINQLGIQYYSKLIDALLENKITPFITLFHWDLPQALYDRYGGMLSTPEFVLDFTFYAEVCFKNFGDRVKDWITFNEPLVVAQLAYGTGAFAPGHTSNRIVSQKGDTAREPWRVLHSQILAHAHAAKAYRHLKQDGRIGITFNADWAEPYSEKIEDIAAAARKLDFFVAIGADPIFGSGDYPESCKNQLGLRLPSFTEEERNLVKGSADFLGINHYTTNYILQDPNPPSDTDFMGNVIQTFTGSDGKDLGPGCGVSWVQVVPWGLRKILQWAYQRYHVPIYITENGIPFPGEASLHLPEVLDDSHRIDYHIGYLNAMKDAIRDGADIRSYFAWSLTDNWEWADGFETRFGVTYVEKDEHGRVLRYWPKKSASKIREWFNNYINK